MQLKGKGREKRKAFIRSITKKGSKFACNDETTSENLEVITTPEASWAYEFVKARILFEISERTECIANNLVQELNLNKSYMSRILRKFREGRINREKTLNILKSRKFLLKKKKSIIYYI